MTLCYSGGDNPPEPPRIPGPPRRVGILLRALSWRPPIGAGVEGLEAHGIPVRQQNLADRLLDGLVTDASCTPWGAVGRHEPTQRVGTMRIHERDRQQDVAKVLAHLATVLGQNVAQTQHIAVRGLVKHQGSDGHHGVKPPAGLVDGLTDEVTRVVGLELLLRTGHMRVSPLGEGHRARIEPGVSHLGHPVIGMAVSGEGHLVNERAMRIHPGDVMPDVLG